MSTRAVYTFKDHNLDAEEVFHVYKHHDGYPEGAAIWISEAIPFAWPLPRFEAAEFAAAFIAGNKTLGGGGLYFTDTYESHGDLEFRYEITFVDGALHVRAFKIDYEESKKSDYKIMAYKEIFYGTLNKFKETYKQKN